MKNFKSFPYFVVLIFVLMCAPSSNNQILYAQIFPENGNQGIYFTVNTTQRIIWDTTYFENNVNIYLWDARISSFSQIAQNLPNNQGYFDWEIPSILQPGTYFKIKIADISNLNNYLMSSNFFTIYDEPAATISNINSINASNDIYLIPNPASNNVQIISQSGNKITELNLTDIKGNVIIRQNFAPTDLYTLNLEKLNNGLYFIQIFFDSNTLVTKKLLVNR